MHELGSWWQSPGLTTGYINVPKCASTSIGRYVGAMGWRTTTEPPPPGSSLVCVRRDPWQSYCSGVVEYAVRWWQGQHLGRVAQRMIHGCRNLPSEFQTYYQKRCDEVDPQGVYILDEHTAPHRWFLEPFSKCKVQSYAFTEIASSEFLGFFDRTEPFHHEKRRSPQAKKAVESILRGDSDWMAGWKEIFL